MGKNWPAGQGQSVRANKMGGCSAKPKAVIGWNDGWAGGQRIDGRSAKVKVGKWPR